MSTSAGPSSLQSSAGSAADGTHRSADAVDTGSGLTADDGGTPVREQTLGQLFATASRDLSILVHKEVELAKAELSRAAKRGGIGAGMLGAAGFLGFFGLIFFSTAAAYGIAALGLTLGWSFLIVAAIYFLGAGLFALIGALNLRKAKGPELTIRTVKDDIAVLAKREAPSSGS